MLTAPVQFRGAFRTDIEARAVYAEAAGIQRIIPAAVAVPADANDAVALVRWATATGTPLVPRGSGSSMSGGAIGPGVIVDLSRLRERRPVDVVRRRVYAGPGVLRGEIDAAARARGLRFPVDPSSGAFCTIGGMAATNAAGAHTLMSGAMRSWVTALDCVFADGSRRLIRRGDVASADLPAVHALLDNVLPRVRAADPRAIQHEGVRKESSGYGLAAFAASGDPLDILVGSEGTLALFVGVEVALEPCPGATASVLAAFPSLDAAVAGTAAARAAAASACELLDRTFLEIARTAGRVPPSMRAVPKDAEAVLLIELEEADSALLSRRMAALDAGLREIGASSRVTALTPDAEHDLWELRHAASPALAALDPALKSMQFIEDGAVPPAHLGDYVRGVRGALDSRAIRGAIFGHAGDAHVHVNPLIDVRRPDWHACVLDLLTVVTDLTARLGGTVTGEHGDGRIRTPLLDAVWGGTRGTAMDLFRAVKNAFDPEELFNPGVKVALAPEGVGDIKYDPTLPALPATARRVLDEVSATRGYARFRLDEL